MMAANERAAPTQAGMTGDGGPVSARYSLRPDTAKLAPMRRFLTQNLASVLPEDQLQLFLVAVTEAATNAIEAHRRLTLSAPIIVGVDVAGRRVTVDDRAGGFDHTAAESTETGPSAARGRGLQIMRGICPDLVVADTPDGSRIELPFPG